MSERSFEKETDEEPKLIIDEDWKSQVQREKEQFKKKQEQEKGDSGDSQPSADRQSAAPATGGDSSDKGTTEPDSSATISSETESSETESATSPPDSQTSAEMLPPASFEFLISGMATQAVAAMGQLPDEQGEMPPANLDFARHYIDLLGIIENKTQGNLSEHEQRFLQETLHQLRMLFVAVKNS
jgi:hypothetical protein